MPASFCFTKPDNTNEELNTVDEKIAIELDQKMDEKYNIWMDSISNFGFGILLSLGGSEVTEELFNKWLSNIETKEPERYKGMIEAHDNKLIPCLRKFLYQDYKFKAWR